VKWCTAPFSVRQGQAAVTFNHHMYILGGFGGTNRYNDIWKSNDGAIWNLIRYGLGKYSGY
jgi:hypothetical protein